MYEERKNVFSLKDIILQIILIVLFVFIMIWLFPTKSYLNDNYVASGNLSEELDKKLQSLYGRLYADNIGSMTAAAQGYFTNERLPQTIGDTVTIKLSEMYDKKLVLELMDSNNKSCDTEKSFVEVTKMDNEYQMKVQLTCSDYSDYIIVYMGCYDYCDNCDKEEPKPTNPTPNPVVKKYKYKYRKEFQNEWSDWSDWSDWTKDILTADDYTQVESKKEDIITGYEQVYEIVDYKDEEYIDYVENKEKVQVGTETKVVDTKPAKKVTISEGYYTEWVDAGYVTSNYPLYDSKTVDYIYQSDRTIMVCENTCKNVTEYTYKKYTRKYIEAKTNLSCASYGNDYKLSGTNCVKKEEVPVYEEKTVTKEITKVKKVPVWGYVNGDPIRETVTYYRSRTRKLITEAFEDIKWSLDSEDKKLLADDYVLVGKVEL